MLTYSLCWCTNRIWWTALFCCCPTVISHLWIVSCLYNHVNYIRFGYVPHCTFIQLLKVAQHLQENVNDVMFALSTQMHALPILPHHSSVSALIVIGVYRLEFQYGFSIPVSQLEGVCGRLCPALCLCRGGTYLHAWKSQVLPWGNSIFLKGAMCKIWSSF